MTTRIPDYRATPWHQISMGLPPLTRISENFRLYELTVSETADRLGLNNRFDRAACLRNAVYLARQVLQPIRADFGPFTPNSIKNNLVFDQLILECYDPAKGPNSGWVHVSIKPPGATQANRGQVLSYIRRGGGFVYLPGLTTQ